MNSNIYMEVQKAQVTKIILVRRKLDNLHSRLQDLLGNYIN